MFKNCSFKKTSFENLSQVLALPWDYHPAALLVLLPQGWCLKLWAHSEWQEEHCALQLPALTQLWESSHAKPFSAGICCFPLSKGFCRMRAIPNSQAFCSHPYQRVSNSSLSARGPAAGMGISTCPVPRPCSLSCLQGHQAGKEPALSHLSFCFTLLFAAFCKMKIILMGEL